MEQIVINLYLFYGAVKDGFTKKIPVWYLSLGGILIYLYSWDQRKISVSEYFYAMIPGVLFLLYRFIKKEGIGYADGIMLCLLGYLLRIEVWKVCCLSFLLISLFSLGLLAAKKVTLTTRLPYYPFLFGAYFICQGMNYV